MMTLFAISEHITCSSRYAHMGVYKTIRQMEIIREASLGPTEYPQSVRESLSMRRCTCGKRNEGRLLVIDTRFLLGVKYCDGPSISFRAMLAQKGYERLGNWAQHWRLEVLTSLEGSNAVL